MPALRVVQDRARVVAGWAAAGLGLSIPLSTTLDNVLIGTVIVTCLMGGRLPDHLKALRNNLAILALASFFGLLMLGTVHGDASWGERLRVLWKYNDFLLPVFFVPLFADPEVRRRALWAFGLVMALTLALSILLVVGWQSPVSWIRGGPRNATVFKYWIAHSLFMSFTALLAAAAAVRQETPWKRYALFLLAAIASLDVFMFVRGRTGQVVLTALIVYWFWRRFGLRGLIAGALTASMIVAISYQVSSVFRGRIAATVQEMERAQGQTRAPVTASVALRLEWYSNTVNIIRAHPLLGVGTGSFARAYADSVSDPGAIKPAQPHNQFLLTATELGLPGLLALVALFAALWWWVSQGGEDFHRELGQGLLILMTIGCMANSLLLDHAEGLFFAWMLSLVLAGMSLPSRQAAT